MRVALLGGSFKSRNLGLEALTTSLINSIWRHAPEADICVFDFVRKAGPHPVQTQEGERSVMRFGLNDSRRLWSNTTLRRMEWGVKWPLLDGAGLRALRTANLVIDISGGDSFTDLYGERRLRAMCRVKELVLGMGVPLVLGPQTYGPFRSEEAQRRARAILLGARQVWARDVESQRRAEELVGGRSSFSCRLGVDLAFALPAAPCSEVGGVSLAGLGQEAVGLNVSGLLWNGGAAQASALGLSVDYRAMITALVSKLLESQAGPLVLVPHVLEGLESEESDPRAAREVLAVVQPTARDRVLVPEGSYSASEAKALIRSLSWFAGSRMHATIAGLSSGTPTVGLAYSLKFSGVFASAGCSQSSLDLRELSTEAAVEASMSLFRTQAGRPPKAHELLAALKTRASAQVGEILDV
jgi:colanic acid/amylovoran biosynthesis protein